MDDTPATIWSSYYNIPTGIEIITYHDGTTLVQRYPKRTPLEALGDTEPLSETWRNPEGDPIERPDPDKYPVITPRLPPFPELPETPEEKAQREERGKRWREGPEGQEHYRKYWQKKGYTAPEQVWAYGEACKEYDRQMAGYGPARKPRPEDFRGKSRGPSGQPLSCGPRRWPSLWEIG